MKCSAFEIPPQETLAHRTRHREEMGCQIVHDSIHRRQGWMKCFRLELAGRSVGYAGVAVGGPWKDRPTILEFYVLPEERTRAFDLFEVFLAESRAQALEIQSSDVLPTVMLHTYGRDVESEKIVFRDGRITDHPSQGAVLRAVTPESEIRTAIEARQGGGEWVLERGETRIAKGGILFHYNRPYGDIYMDVEESFRRNGYGTYLVQEIKRECYALGAVPAARCSPSNTASRKTLMSAGFIPYAHILCASIPTA